jgi:Heat induced stress protein YflT
MLEVMNIIGRTIAIGVFSDHKQAEQALEALHHAGFTDEQIGFITRHRTSDGENEFPDDAATNVPSTAAGAVVGGVIGAAVSLLIPGLGIALAGGILAAVFGAVAGGFAGSLVSIGIPEEEAHYYQEQLMAGRTLVTVHAHGLYEEATAVLRASGALDANVVSGVPADIETSVAELHNSNDGETPSTENSSTPDNTPAYDSYAGDETELRAAVSPSRDIASEPTAYMPVTSDPGVSHDHSTSTSV